jgi:hypothetical protein
MIGGRQLVAPLLADGTNSADVIGISVNLLIPVGDEFIPSVTVLPAAEALPRAAEPPPNVLANFEFVSPPPQRGSTVIFETVATFAISGEDRYYELRVVSFDENGRLIEEMHSRIRLDNEDLQAIYPFDPSKLPALFGRLPNDRYRLYLKEDEAERLILDFIIQDGQPIEMREETEGGMDELPVDSDDAGTDQRGALESDLSAEAGEADFGRTLPGGERTDGSRLPLDLPQFERQWSRLEAAELFAEKFGQASFLSHGGIVVGAAVLAASTTGRWEKSMDRVMEQFGRRRPFTRRRNRVTHQSTGAGSARA